LEAFRSRRGAAFKQLRCRCKGNSHTASSDHRYHGNPARRARYTDRALRSPTVLRGSLRQVGGAAPAIRAQPAADREVLNEFGLVYRGRARHV